MDKPMLVFKLFSIPSLLTRTTNDITQIQMLFTMGLQVVTRGPIMAIWAIGKILGKSEYWIWAVVVAVIVNDPQGRLNPGHERWKYHRARQS